MKVRMSALLVIMLLSWSGFNHRATAAKTEGEPLHSPSLLDTGEFILSEENEESSDAQCDSDGNCYRGDGISQIVSPRKTWLLDDKPTLRWFAVEGVESYTVKVEGVGVNWETSVTETSIVYDGPPLQPGETYLFTVDANNGESASEETFTMLPEDKAASVRAEIAQLEESSEALPLNLAQLYAKYGLISEAIVILKTLVDGDTQKAEVYCQLSTLYQEVELQDFAKYSQEKAQELGGCN